MSAKIITVFNQKGGCAKTMSTMQLAGTFGLRGLKVFVVDMDPQNTAALWFHQATPEQPFPAEVMSMAPLKEGFLDKIAPLAAKFDVILIDCPPALGSRVPWASLIASDFALIPVAAVMDNVWASKQAEELVLEARQARERKGINTELKAAYLLSMVRRGNVFEHCLETLKTGAKIPILKSTVAMRNAFPESQLFGCVAKSFGKSVATSEIDAVADEIAKLLDLKLTKGK
ncbi:ParA family protein [Glaciimonas sp. Gout2]|uniref:ParA family protein n=1 Tax=unclassified Glaciimonas TaxID=2644401 RepID=UPI002B23A5BA|nr:MULTISPECIES: ParA family protein [unclassified Glaciimonas]MEB0014355.1 ParA family protein [Glaciimonas sp. Cout2]MEB0084224.1 ParA family protein [Glaciimonas sp. Gout2]